MSGQGDERGGARLTGDGVRFRVRSRNATRVELCLFDDGDQETGRHDLERTGDNVWQLFLPDVRPGQRYGYRVDGPWEPQRGHLFDPAKLLLDPWALAITREPDAHEALGLFDGGGTEGRSQVDSGPFTARSLVVDETFDWQGDTAPRVPWADTVIYEAHVRGMTWRHPDVPEAERGTYLGLAAEPVVDHLRSLGVTTVELLPVQQIASEPQIVRRGLSNYFGYSPLGFLAPHAGYASGASGQQVAEFKQMVRRLHRAGLEVVLDVVFNHTAEGGPDGPTLSLRGLDNSAYYRLRPDDPSRYEDFTGCGNTVDCRDELAWSLVVEALVYWVEQMHVDGFRFDLAPALARGERLADRLSVFESLRDHPALAGVKWIAEPWDLGPEGYRLGTFPDGWREWNDRFRDGVRAFWRGDRATAPAIDAALRGSPDVFLPPRDASAGIAFVACHDGFTLEDLVSYRSKRNEANGEHNRDGHEHNLSHDWGVEGPTTDARIVEVRSRIKRALLATLALASGVPMLSHGDELGRTQRGNNNAYCHDSELTWIDWRPDRDGSDLRTFVREAFALRHEMAAAGPPEALSLDGRTEGATGHGMPLLSLLRPSGDGDWLLLLNGSDRPRLFRLPGAPSGRWAPRLATWDDEPAGPLQRTARVPAHGLLVLRRLSD